MAVWNREVTCLYCGLAFRLSAAPRRRVSGDPKEKVGDEKVREWLGLRQAPRMGPVLEPPRGLLARMMRSVFLEGDRVRPDGTDLRKICPRCHMELPLRDANSEGASRSIALVGSAFTGKSNYVGTLIHALKKRFQDEVGFTLRALTTFNFEDPDRQVLSDTLWETRYNSYLRLDSDGPHAIIPQTQRAEQSPATRIPLIYRFSFQARGTQGPGALHRHIDLAFFDASGEDLTDPHRAELFIGYIAGTAGVILLIDPFELPHLRDHTPRDPFDLHPAGAARSQADGARLALTTVLELLERRHVRLTAPVAIVLSKADEYLGRVYPGSTLREEAIHRNGFDAESCCLASEELHAYLMAWGGASSLPLIRQHLPDHAFFAVSALGSRPRPESPGSMSLVVDAIRPHRIADPLLWLFWRLGYIPDKSGNWEQPADAGTLRAS